MVSFRKHRNFSRALSLTERTRRFLGMNSQTNDSLIAITYFRTIIDLASPPNNRRAPLSRHEAAFLISDVINSRIAYEDKLIHDICESASELELPWIVVDDYTNKWYELTKRVEQLYQIHSSFNRNDIL